MEFRAEEFLSEKVSREEVEALKKDELLKLAEYLKVKVTKQTSRMQVKVEVCEKLVIIIKIIMKTYRALVSDICHSLHCTVRGRD